MKENRFFKIFTGKFPKKVFPAVFLFLLSLILSGHQALGQTGPVPSDRYFRGTDLILQGDLENALRFYQEELKSATKIGILRWIDSICYYTMIGEIHYYMGNHKDALECYNAALTLHLQYSQWLSRVEYPVGYRSIQPQEAPWGRSLRGTAPGVFSSKAAMTVGDIITKERLQQGGLMTPLKQIRIEPLELLKCISISMRRRVEILGPLVEFDPMSPRLLDVMTVRTIQPNHWSVTWLDVLLGIALEGVGKKAEARDILKKSLLIAGQTDHSLTATALFELGRLSVAEGQIKEAIKYFREAGFSAWQYGDLLMIEESFRWFAALAKTDDLKKALPELLAAFNWSKNERGLQWLTISLGEELAEGMILVNNLKAAYSGLQFIDRQLNNRVLRSGFFADRWNYLQSLLFYANGNVKEGDAALNRALDGLGRRSTRLYQISLLGFLTQTGGRGTTGTFSIRNITDLYDVILREPTQFDWQVNPLETLAVRFFVPPQVYERWFRLLLERDMNDKAFVIAERTRRLRFFSMQGLYGRISSLRILLEAPTDRLSDANKMLRNEIFLQEPLLGQLIKETAEIKQRLQNLPAVPKEETAQKQQKDLLLQLAQKSAQEEARLRYLAIGHLPIPELFPEILPLADIQARLSADTSILYFFESEGEMFGYMITKDGLDTWKIGSSAILRKHIAAFLKTIGSSEANKPLQYKDLADEKWHKESEKILSALLGDPASEGIRFSTTFREMIIVPESVLWYLPFEALSLSADKDKSSPLISIPELTIRYAATAGLSVIGRSKQDYLGETVVVPGKMFAKVPEKIMDEEINRMSQNVSKLEVLPPGSLPVPAPVFAPRLKRLVVFNEITANKNPLQWVLFDGNKNINTNSISQWGYLPWGAPQLMILPGFRSHAENALKNGGSGQEYFIPILMLQARGAETILFSRWRTGGRSTYDLVNAFLKNINEKDKTMAAAWKQAVAQIQETDFVLEEEPRLSKPGVNQKLPKINHPLFWSSFMLIDPGEPPVIDESAEPADSSKEANPNMGTKPETAPVPASDKKETKKEEKKPAEPSDTAAKETEAPGKVVPKVRIIPDKKEGDSPKAEPKEDPKSEPKTDSKSEPKEEPKKEPSKATGKKTGPITDESLKKEDEEADDFYGGQM
ncbi:MAG: hypothetical protein Q4G69_03325 [Planctomycetia bacterium]|nr:hypothetical protein [Planctomycetia bacterium]